MFDSRRALDARVRAAYLARLGAEAEPPSADALQTLLHRQVERVPYETMWIHAGEAWGVDPHAAARRIAQESRGGYCYHLNGAFGLLLSSLGYRVRGHVGGVHGPNGPDPAATGNHMALTVEELPTAANPGGVWYVDAGLGDALHDPLPLVAGPHDQPPFRLSLERVAVPGAQPSWHLTHDPSGGFTGMTWTPGDARATDFEAMHRHLSTSPDSGFVQVAMAQRRDATGVDVVRGLVLIRIGSDAAVGEPITSRAEWFDLLADRFDLRFESSTAAARDHLWRTVCEAHRRWLDSGGRDQR